MKNALCSLAVLLLVLLFAPCHAANAETTAADVHIVYALDFSDSMFNETDVPNHAEIQAHALYEFLTHYNVTCVNVTVDVLPWGTTAGPAIGTTITSPSTARLFWSEVASSTTASRSNTNHAVAFKSALDLFTNPSVTNILVFTTDEATYQNDGYSLNTWIPPGVTVYAISLGNDSVYQYVEHNIVTKSENHFHAENSTEFEEVLERVLAAVNSQFCLF